MANVGGNMKARIVIRLIAGLAIAALLVAAGDAIAYGDEQRMGGWLDEVIIRAEPDAWQALDEIGLGELDVYAQRLVDVAIYDHVVTHPDIWYKTEIGVFYTLRINPYGPEFDTGMVNPFYLFDFPEGVRTMNEVLHKFIDRAHIADHILGGLARPKYASQHTQMSDYDRYFDDEHIAADASISALEHEYRYDPVTGMAWLEDTMAAINDLAPGTVAGNADEGWLYDGNPIGMTIAIRDDDPLRTQIGEYVGAQLEKMGFEFTPYYGNMGAIFQNLVNVEEETTGGGWNVYTGGWLSPQIPSDSGFWFIYFHTNFWPDGIPAFAHLDIPEDFYDAAFDLAFLNFGSFEERDSLYEICLPSHMKYGMFYLVDCWGLSPLSTDVDLAGDRARGILGSWMWALTAHFRDTAGNPQVGGTLRVAMHDLLVGPWNPIAGSTDMFVITATGDMGTFPDTRDGLRWAGRIEGAEVTATSGLPVLVTNPWVQYSEADTITAPGDAWRDWDPVTQTPRSVQDALDNPEEPWGLDDAEVRRYSVAYYPEEIWDHQLHDDSTLSFADFLYRWILTYDRGQEESAIYDSAARDGLGHTRSNTVGMRFTVGGPDDNFGLKVETWSQHWEMDAERMVEDMYPNYAQGNAFWHTIALGILEEREGKMAFGEGKAWGLPLGWISFIDQHDQLEAFSDRLDIIRESTAYSDDNVPYYEFIKAQYGVQYAGDFDDEIVTRTENLREWVDTKNHLWVGSGPYMLKTASPDSKTIVLERFAYYPDPADRWLFLLLPLDDDIDDSSVDTATGTGTARFATSEGAIEGLEALPVPSDPPHGHMFPHGVFSFKITDLNYHGQTVDISIEFPDPVPTGTKWWKHHDGQWHDYDIPITIDGNTITITLTDGGVADIDGAADGTITDPGGPGYPYHVVGWEGSAISKPVVVAPWIVLLAAMAGAGLLVLKRRRAQI